MRAFSTLMILPRSGRIAWKLRSRASTADPPALSPSTRNSSAASGFAIEQSASLPGRPPPPSADLRRIRSRALRAAWRARLAWISLLTIACASFGCSSRNSASLALQVVSTRPRIEGLPELGLGLALELRLAQLHRDDRGEPLAAVVAGQRLLLLLEQPLVARVVVQRPRQRGLEAGEVRAALVGVDVVRERERGLDVAAVPLHRDLDLALVGLVLEVDDVLVHAVLAVVDVGDEVADAALEVEVGAARPPARSSISSSRRPLVRNAISRSRCASVSNEKSVSSKISPSGRKVMVVPVSVDGSPLLERAQRVAALVLLLSTRSRRGASRPAGAPTARSPPRCRRRAGRRTPCSPSPPNLPPA